MTRAILSSSLIALVLAGGLAAAQDDTEYRDKLDKLQKNLALKHVDVGNYLAGRKMHGWARDEYNKAIKADPDCASARQKLGDKRSDDGMSWEIDPTANIKSANDVKDADDLVKVKTEYEKRLTKLGESVAKEWFSVGTAAEKAGLTAEAEMAFKKAIEYDANHKDARKKLGYEKTKDGAWVSPSDKALRAELVEGIAKAPSGSPDSSPSDTASKLGLTTRKQASEHFVIESPHLSAQQLASLVQHAEHAYAMFHKMFNQSGLLPEKYNIVILQSKEQHQKYVDAFYSGDERRRTFTRDQCAGMGGYPRSECYQGDRDEIVNMDYCVHYPVQSMMRAASGGQALWLLEGMALWYTSKMKGTAAWACVDLAGTGTGGSGKNYQDPKNWPFVIKTWIKEGKDPDINATIKAANWADLDGAETVKAWSLCDFLIAEHKERFIELMQDLKSQKDTGETSFTKIFGWSLAELDAKWKSWARVTYDSAK